MVQHISYKHPPLAFVVIEIRHPSTGYLTRGELAGIKQRLNSSAPLQREEQYADFVLGPNGGSANPTKTAHRFLARDHRTSVTYHPESLVVETTAYKGWTALRSFLSEAIDARVSVSSLDGIDRVGIRFIDEIRVEHAGGSVDWTPWIDASLLAPDLSSENLHLQQQQSSLVFSIGQGPEALVIRYGATVGPPAVADGQLARPNIPSAGPYFLLDTDASWAPPAGTPVPEFDSQFILDKLTNLHQPVVDIFELAITQQLRDEVLNID